MNKRIVSIALTATTVLWAVGFATLPLVNAQTTADLQAQIAALLAQIQQLQAQLNANTGAANSTQFTSDLTVGSTGAQVTALQQILINKGYLTAVSAPTGYFGSLTKAALAKFQAANGISPAVGYFGPITRAFINSTEPTSPTSPTGPTNPVAPASGLGVSLAADNPVSGSLITSSNGGNGAARVPVLAVDFTAGNAGPVTITAVNFNKTGVLSDSSIAGAYLIQNGQVIAQYNSVSNGVISFSGLNWQIPAGQTQEVQLAIDVAGGLSAGNTTAFALLSASEVTAWSGSANTAVTPNGNFPINGNTFTVTSVTNPSLATLTIASSSIGTQVTAGTQGNIVAAYNFSVGNSKVWLKNINFHVVGSANVANIQNVKLVVNGTQVGATLPSVPSDGQAFFNLSAAPAVLNTGSNNVQVMADIVGSPSYTFQFEVLNSFDVLAIDSQYNVPITVTNNGGIGTQVTIQQGQITVTQASNTPTGNIAKGQSQVALARFAVYAAGEAVKIKYLNFNIQLAGQNPTLALSQQIQNVALVDDAGNQVGSTINQPPSANVCTNPGYTAAYNASTSAATVNGETVPAGLYEDCFGTSGSPINYVIPANTTRILTLQADIQSGASFSAITGNLGGNTQNLQGMTSSQVSNSGAANGVTLTLVSSSLTVNQNNALGSQNVSAGTTGLRIGSYAFTASSAEGVNLNTITVMLTPGTTTAAFQNLKLMVNGTQFGTTQGSVNGNTNYAFSGALNIPVGTTENVDVYADSLSTATGTYAPATSLTGYSGVGQTSFTSINPASGFSLAGQTISFNGQPALTVSADSTNPPAGQVVQNSTGNTVAAFRFTETSNVEAVNVSQLNVVDMVGATSTVLPAFNTLQLYNGSTLLATANSPVADASGTAYIYSFNSFSMPLLVPQGGSVSVTLKGNVGTYSNGAFTDDSTSTFEIATTTDSNNNTTALAVVAHGATSNKLAVTTLQGASGNPQTVLRTVLTPSVAAIIPNGGRNTRSASDSVASVSLSANSAGPAALNTIKLTFNGTLISNSSTFMAGVDLLDSNGVSVTADGSLVTSSTNLSDVGGFSKTWTFVTSSQYVQISAGTQTTFTVRVNDTTAGGAVAPASGVSPGLSIVIQGTGDMTYYDALSGGKLVPSIPSTTPSYTLPISASIVFPQGS